MLSLSRCIGGARRYLLLASAVLLLAAGSLFLGSCGAGGDGEVPIPIVTVPTPPLGGGAATSVERFEVPVGETRVVDSDLVVRSTGDIVIAGDLQVQPGVSVALIAEKDLTLSGSITSLPGPARGRGSGSNDASSSRQEGGTPPPQLVFGGTNVRITGPIRVDNQVIVYGATADSVITLSGEVFVKSPPQAPNRFENGAHGSPIEVGSDRGNEIARRLGAGPVRPARVVVEGALLAASGAFGFSDFEGVREGRNLTMNGTRGGDGGGITIAAGEIAVPGRLVAGKGGPGGVCNPGITATRGIDGIGPSEKGGNFSATSGDGGNGGDIVLLGRIVGTLGPGTHPGEAGPGGGVHAVTGDGGPGGAGGDAVVGLGSPGAHGSGPNTDRALPPPEPGFITVSGGNGGDSEDPTINGGNGGTLNVTMRDGKPVQMQVGLPQDPSLGITGLNGGFGFNGCSVAPTNDGTNGGRGGTVTIPVAVPGDKIREGLEGGAGGDGLNRRGAGGAGGAINGTKTGPDGTGGGPCAFVTGPGTSIGFIAVVLDQPIGSNGLHAGDVVPLVRIRGGRPNPAEPLIDDRGCDSDHLHAHGSEGIDIRLLVVDPGNPNDTGSWQVAGPFPDTNQRRCGYGKLTVVPTPEIRSQNPRIR